MAKRATTVGNETIADSLRAQGIPFGIGVARQSGKRIYVVEFYPFLEIELQRLLEASQLHLDGLKRLRQQIEAREPTRSGSN